MKILDNPNKVVIVGGGLSGLSAAHTVLERGGRVLVLDKKPFLGGNSTKATSGINGATTRTQIASGVADTIEQFEKDTALSATGGKSDVPTELGKVLVRDSAPAVEWLIEKFGLDLTILGRLGGHSFPRTHRGKERFPGMTITYALMTKMEDITKSDPDKAKVINNAEVTKLLHDEKTNAVTGVEYTFKGKTYSTAAGGVVIATGGYGADFSDDSILVKHRPDLKHYSTTNGDHCTGDGITLSEEIGGNTIDMKYVQVHPTGLVHPDDPKAKTKWLAAEALRGAGGLLLDANGRRFVNELGRRDYVSGKMFANKGPFTLVLNGEAAKKINWHCEHYEGRGLMTKVTSGRQLASHMKCNSSTLRETFATYNKIAEAKKDPYGKRFFASCPWKMDDTFYAAIVTPVVHYCMGGLHIDTLSRVLSGSNNAPIGGLYAAGEVCGAVHGINRLGGSSLLDCVVFGRISGDEAAKYLLDNMISRGNSSSGGGSGPRSFSLNVSPFSGSQSLNFQFSVGKADFSSSATASSITTNNNAEEKEEDVVEDKKGGYENTFYSMDEVAKHSTEKDCWVAVNGDVLNATDFLNDHPGGKPAIMLYAGKDASKEFNMLHEPDVVSKYAPEILIGKVKITSKL